MINTIEVESVDDFAEKIEQSGGKIAMPKMAIQGIGWLAYGIDPEGNLFGIMQGDESAA